MSTKSKLPAKAARSTNTKVNRQTSGGSIKQGACKKSSPPNDLDKSFKKLTKRFTNANIVMKLGSEKKARDGAAAKAVDDTQVPEAMDLEMEFEVTMMPVLADCSRQKLRSFYMNLLKYGSNINERVTTKDIVAAFQESNIKLPGRALQLISEVYLDARGINFQKLYRRLEAAQSKTGRDSVLARQLTGDRTHYNQMSEEMRELDFLRRIEEQLVKCPHYFDLDSYRAACLQLDTSKTGKLSLKQMRGLAKEHALPIYGALFTNLLNRCDDEKNGSASWPEFMNFLFKAMETYATNNPNKPKLGTNKPKLEQGSVIAKRSSLCVKQPDVQIPEISQSKLSRGKLLLASMKGMKQTRNPGESNGDTQKADKPTLLESREIKLSEEDSKIPTKEYIIRGQPVRLVIPADLEQSTQANIDPPQQRLKLDWVYGYNGRDVGNNLLAVSNGNLLYVVGHIAVLLNVQEEHKQRHYKEHSSFITSLSLHSDKIQVASSQSRYLLSPAHIRVWRSDNLQTVCVIEDKAYVVNSYTHLSFCVVQGKALSSIDNSIKAAYSNQLLVGEQRDTVHMSVWDIGTQSKIATASISTTKLCCLAFNPEMPLSVITLGKEHFQWWRLNRERGSLDAANEPNFGMGMKAMYYNCMYYTEEGDLITGDSNGTVYVWPLGATTPSNHIKHAHEGPITAVALVGNALFTSSKNRVLSLWKYGYHLDKIIDINIDASDGHGKSVLHIADKLFVGTTANAIISYELKFNSHSLPVHIMLSPTHYARGVAGDVVSVVPLSSNERDTIFVCCGSTGTINSYDSDRRIVLSSTVVQDVVMSSFNISLAGDLAVIGTQKGKVIVWKVNEDFVLEELAVVGVSKSKVGLVSTSPNGTTIAAVCNCTVYIVVDRDGDRTWTISGKFKVVQSNGPITHIDWSTEVVNGCHLLRVFCYTSLHTVIWDTTNMTCIQSIEPLYSCHWSSQKFPLTYTTAGVWYSKQCIEDGLQCIDVSNNRKLIAVCSKQGYLCLFQYPCTSSGAFSHTYKSHIQPADVSFTRNNLILTSGVSDCCVMQWKIV